MDDPAAREEHHGSVEDPIEARDGDGLRVAGFLTTALGALLAGIGGVLTWVTVGIEGQGQLDTRSPGIDLVDGVVVLAAAGAMLIAVLASRLAGTRTARRVAAVVCLVAGLVVMATAGAFLLTANTRFDPVSSDELIGAIAMDTGVPIAEVREQLDAILTDLGGFTEIGLGPSVALLGGLLGAVGGVLILAWVMRQDTRSDDGDDGDDGTRPLEGDGEIERA